jgi:hypothetical protein
VWGTFIATNKPTDHLSQMNHEFGGIIEAALKFGDIHLLAADIQWVEYLLASYRQPREVLIDYLQAYHQAVRIHLGDSASMIAEWLFNLLSNKSTQ